MNFLPFFLCKRLITHAVIVGLFMSLTSCVASQEFEVDVDSFARPDLMGKNRYILMPGEKDVNTSDLQFLEFSSYIEKVLLEKGYVKALSAEQADVAIFLSYGIGNPQSHQYSYALPTYGQTGVSSSMTTGTISSFGGMGAYSGTTTYTPTYGVTGYVPQTGNYTTYTRFLFVAGYDVAASAKEGNSVQAWKTEVLSTGSSNDLRLVFPYMVAAMKPYIATNTGKKVRVNIYEDAPAVRQLRGEQTSDER